MIVQVKKSEDGELYIELPPELLDETGWTENTTTLVLILEDDGTIILRESDK